MKTLNTGLISHQITRNSNYGYKMLIVSAIPKKNGKCNVDNIKHFSQEYRGNLEKNLKNRLYNQAECYLTEQK